jgi:hypothetical protein
MDSKDIGLPKCLERYYNESGACLKVVTLGSCYLPPGGKGIAAV